MKTALLVLILAGGSLGANEDLALPWHSLTVGFGDAKSGDSVRVAARGDRLSEISVRWHGKSFAVPASELGSAPKPQVKTLDVLQGQFSSDIHSGVPYLIVAMHYGTASFGEYPT